MIKRICKRCNALFHVPPSKVKEGKGIYCSRKCYYGQQIPCECKECGTTFNVIKSVFNKKTGGKFCSQECFHNHKKGINIKCKTCKKEFYIQRNQYKNKMPKFCSMPCFYKSRNFNVVKTGGKQEYNAIRVNGHKSANCSGYIMEHRHIVEKFLGRELNPSEVVHHIDENTTNNNIENLYLFPSTGLHTSYHNNVRYGNCEKINKSNLLF